MAEVVAGQPEPDLDQSPLTPHELLTARVMHCFFENLLHEFSSHLKYTTLIEHLDMFKWWNERKPDLAGRLAAYYPSMCKELDDVAFRAIAIIATTIQRQGHGIGQTCHRVARKWREQLPRLWALACQETSLNIRMSSAECIAHQLASILAERRHNGCHLSISTGEHLAVKRIGIRQDLTMVVIIDSGEETDDEVVLPANVFSWHSHVYLGPGLSSEQAQIVEEPAMHYSHDMELRFPLNPGRVPSLMERALATLFLSWGTLPDATRKKMATEAGFTLLPSKRKAEDLRREGKRTRFLPLPELLGVHDE